MGHGDPRLLLSIFSIPVFLSGILLLLVAANYLGPFYKPQYVPISTSLVGNLECMVLPTIAIAIPTAALTMQITRTAMIEAFAEPHIQMAHAKGATLRNIRYVHALKNVVPQVLTLAGVPLRDLPRRPRRRREHLQSSRPRPRDHRGDQPA